MIAKGPEKAKVMPQKFPWMRKFVEHSRNSQGRIGNFPDCTHTKSFSVQWGETDKVTHIKLHLRFHVVFSSKFLKYS